MKNLPLKSLFLTALFVFSSATAATIQTHNQVLTKIGSKTITVLDVKREMDRQIYMHDPKMFGNTEAICGYYFQNWKSCLQKIINDEVYMLEAEHMKYKIPTADITQKIAQMFGDNEVEAYKFLSITPEQARTMGERELYSGHVAWMQVWNKTLMEVTPKAVVEAYSSYAANLTKKDTWTYQTLYVSTENELLLQQTTERISHLLKDGKCQNLTFIIDQIQNENDKVTVGLSKDITLQTHELSASLLAILEKLEANMTSDVITASRNGTFTGKILQLKEHKKQEIPPFATVREGLKNSIVNSLGEKNSQDRFAVLYKQYDVEGLFGKTLSSSKLEPFALLDE